MRSLSLLSAIGAVLCVALPAGCAPSSSPAAVLVTVEYPGASPKIVDELCCLPVESYLRGASGIATMTCVSSADHCEIYVQGQPNLSAAELESLVRKRMDEAQKLFPKPSHWTLADVSGNPLPPLPEIREVESLNFDIDRDKTANLGLSISDVFNAISKAKLPDASSKDAVKTAGDIVIESPMGAKVRLSEVATVKKVRQPDHIIRHWPKPE